MRQIIKEIRYFLEAVAVKISLFLFKIIGVQKASNYGAKIAQFVGKKLPVHKLAKNNIKKALPALKDPQINHILDDMWDNLGRIVGEFIHICSLDGKKLKKYVKVSKESQKNIEDIKKTKKGGIIISAHIGNWEIGPKILIECGLNVKALYRPLNNKLVEDMTAKIRGFGLIPKSSQGSKQMISEIKNGNFVIIMIDQKISDGEEIQFFHDKAITTISIAKIAAKYNVPVIPTRVIRNGKKFDFELEVEKKLDFIWKNGKIKEDLIDFTRLMNEKLENWIKQYPAQWFWVHNRWKK